MLSRRTLKEKARQSFKKHYFIFVLICAVAGFLGASGGSSLQESRVSSVREDEQQGEIADNAATTVNSGLMNMINGQSLGKLLDKASDQAFSGMGLRKEAVLGRSRGVFASLVNKISSGTILTTLVSSIISIIDSGNTLLVMGILLSVLLMLFVWFYLTNVLSVISARIFLEGRVYEEVSFNRFLFLSRVKKWTNAALIMLVTSLFKILWMFTIVGGVIKAYAYRMVPYITAENPAVKPLDAINLSRKMMYGHKWECFKLELSFIGWNLLDFFTFGLVGTFFSAPYRQATISEYYVCLRNAAIEKGMEGSEYLNDRYLYEKAEREDLLIAYEKNIDVLAEKKPPRKAHSGVSGFIADQFGVTLFNDSQEQKYDEVMAERATHLALRYEMAQKAYPGKLSPIPETEKKRKQYELYSERRYSIWSLILMFFIFSFVGWIWEVSLHLISDGTFVNRGMMHGPWLPIYGAGGALILVILYKLRGKPAREFAATILLCGCVEYFTSWFLELTQNGQKWWDYSGYFLNLNGRICAEGLLVFGLGGMAIVYFLAPLLDNVIRKLRLRVLVPICLILLIIFGWDQIYSHKHPNTGKGITDYAENTMDRMFCMADGQAGQRTAVFIKQARRQAADYSKGGIGL